MRKNITKSNRGKRKKLTLYIKSANYSFALVALIVTSLVVLFFKSPNYWSLTEHAGVYVVFAKIIAVLIAGAVAAVFLKKSSTPKGIAKISRTICLIWIGFFGLVTIALINGKVAYEADSVRLISAAQHTVAQPEMDYLAIYPFQENFVWFLKAIFSVFGYANFLPLYLINLAAIITIVFFISKITESIFQNTKVTFITNILLGLTFFLVSYVSLIYGDIIGLAFAVVALYYYVNYLDSRNITHLAVASPMILIAIFFKGSFSLLLVCAIVFGVFLMIRDRDWRFLVIASMTFVVSSLGQGAFISYYEKSNKIADSADSRLPKAAWIAMGLQYGKYNHKTSNIENITSADPFTSGLGERAESQFSPGQWNYFVTYVNQDSKYPHKLSTDEISKLSKHSIVLSLQTFLADPIYVSNFFKYKLAYMYSDPTFSTRTGASLVDPVTGREYISNSVIAPYVRLDDENPTKLALSLLTYTGGARSLINKFQTLLQFIIYVYAIVAIIALAGRRVVDNDGIMFMVVVLVITFGFYAIWEALPRAAIAGYLLLIPFAALGLAKTAELLQALFYNIPWPRFRF